MKKVICALMGIAVAIFVFCGLGSIGNSDYLHAVNSQSQTEAYKQFVNDGLIGNGQKYTITQYAVDDEGVVKTYRLDVNNAGDKATYYYCVNA